jgi:hypothetical protein
MASIGPNAWRSSCVGFNVDTLMIVVRDAWTRALRETGASRLSRTMAYAYANGEDLIDCDLAKAQFGRGELPEPPEVETTITPMPESGRRNHALRRDRRLSRPDADSWIWRRIR